jgi:mannose-1-phosphate guanylyltransferase/mannose-1-phosphate guanylyltransferase/mannose-6-phosphate isomerase
MLQRTATRVADRSRFAAPLVVTGAAQADAVAAQLAEAGVEDARLIVEPVGRNTAPAVALAALAAAPEDLLLVMPSDHLIGDVDAFAAAVKKAAPVAAEGWLVTFGIRPGRAETGYGYIRRAEAIGEGVFRAAAFVEKPDAPTAEAYLADGGYDWNGGIFLFLAGSYLDALAEHAPDIAGGVRAFLGASASAPDTAAFEDIRAESIDRAVMEHAARVAVVPVEMAWSDVGCWQALYETALRDADGNAIAGEALAIGTRGCLIQSEGPLIVAIGVEDLAIVAAGDAVLIVPREASQRVSEAVAALREQDDKRV